MADRTHVPTKRTLGLQPETRTALHILIARSLSPMHTDRPVLRIFRFAVYARELFSSYPTAYSCLLHALTKINIGLDVQNVKVEFVTPHSNPLQEGNSNIRGFQSAQLSRSTTGYPRVYSTVYIRSGNVSAKRASVYVSLMCWTKVF